MPCCASAKGKWEEKTMACGKAGIPARRSQESLCCRTQASTLSAGLNILI